MTMMIIMIILMIMIMIMIKVLAALTSHAIRSILELPTGAIRYVREMSMIMIMTMIMI